MFSIVIPTFRRPHLVVQAVNSALNQTRQAQEIIVVQSPSEFMIEPEQLPEGINLETADQQLSSGAARNYGAARASQEFIAFLDDDDLWDPLYLENIASAIDSQTKSAKVPDLVYGHLFTDFGYSARSRHFTSLRSVFWVNPGITGSNMVVRRQSFIQLGGFDEHIAPSEDRDYVAKALLQGANLVFEDRARATIRSVSGNRISTRFVASNLRFIRRYWKKVSSLEKALMLILVAYKIAQIPRKRLSSWFVRAPSG